MGSKSSIGIGGLIFWAFIIFQIFDDDDEDTKPVEVDTEAEVEISEQVKEKANAALVKAREMIDIAKEKLDRDVIVVETKEILIETKDGSLKNLKDATDSEIAELTGGKVSQETVEPPPEEIEAEPEVQEKPEKKERFKPI